MDLHFFAGINSILYLIQNKGMDDRCILFAVYEWYCSMCFSLRTVAFITITYKCWSIGSNALQLWFPLAAFVKSLNSVLPSKSLPAFYLENAVYDTCADFISWNLITYYKYSLPFLIKMVGQITTWILMLQIGKYSVVSVNSEDFATLDVIYNYAKATN